jgi:hypothetical protein
MDSTKQSTSTSSQHLARGFQTPLVMHSLEEEHQQWLNDPQAQSEYQQWLRKEHQRRKQLPDPLESLESNFNQIFGESK